MSKHAESSFHERRTQARISAEIPIKVRLPGRDQPVSALNQDLSWGGARFIVSGKSLDGQLPTREAGPLTLLLPWTGGGQITAEAELARAQRLADGRYQVAVRFQSLSPRSQARLEKLLNMLCPRDGVDGPALVRELNITMADASDMRHTLKQVVSGEVTLSAFESYAVDQSIRLVIRGDGDLPSLRLRARVREVTIARAADGNWPALYSLRFAIEHPRPMLKKLVELLLEQLPSDWKAPASSYAEAPDWLRGAHLASPSEVVPPSTDSCSTLEARYPDALNYLALVWGDSEAFDLRFQELIIGEYAEPGGWPEDAWEELGLLQDVHDQAYGVPSVRDNPLRGGRVT
ncbi:pilus biosynthesis protein PilZ [Marichromatium purpuratum 984]|uniref:Pilus biosynthesis protein PilZ n=1 Tax=Marichromatium purpuratum 984 TaxID=765910 RepID=W0DXR0_MARPU|nr:PilZ domain-containing protein [Marichromatium purpuratum]AHF03222.1 pilus biosynthesis protein PilZ [Marichromatium purpuratum 984]